MGNVRYAHVLKITLSSTEHADIHQISISKTHATTPKWWNHHTIRERESRGEELKERERIKQKIKNERRTPSVREHVRAEYIDPFDFLFAAQIYWSTANVQFFSEIEKKINSIHFLAVHVKIASFFYIVAPADIVIFNIYRLNHFMPLVLVYQFQFAQKMHSFARAIECKGICLMWSI